MQTGLESHKVFDHLCEFPWPGVACSRLRRYIGAVNEFLPYSTAQQILRLEARVKTEVDPVSIDECKSEIENLREDGETLLPRLIWGGVLVSIYAAFEFDIERVFRHWKNVCSYPVQFKQESKKDFLSSAKAYAENQVGVQLFSAHRQYEKLNELKQLRNSFVHKGGQMDLLPEVLQKKIHNKVHPGVTLDVVGDQWVGNAQSVEFYLLVVEGVVRSFGEVMVEKCIYHKPSE